MIFQHDNFTLYTATDAINFLITNNIGFAGEHIRARLGYSGQTNEASSQSTC